jgi:hypothetical protein
VSIAVAGVSPRRGRSSALARSIDLDQPKKEGPGGGSIFGRVPQDRGAPAIAIFVAYNQNAKCGAFGLPASATRVKST